MSCFPVRKKTTNEPATPLAVEIAAASSSVEQSSKLQQTSSESVVPPPPPPQMEQQEARQPILLVTKAPLNIPKIEEEKKLEYRFRLRWEEDLFFFSPPPTLTFAGWGV